MAWGVTGVRDMAPRDVRVVDGTQAWDAVLCSQVGPLLVS